MRNYCQGFRMKIFLNYSRLLPDGHLFGEVSAEGAIAVSGGSGTAMVCRVLIALSSCRSEKRTGAIANSATL
jgi:hypothetical protein